MLYLLRSDFRRDVNRHAFLTLLRLCGHSDQQMFERKVGEAHTPYAIAVAMRKVTISDTPVMVVGSYKGESLDATVRVIDTLRDELKYLKAAPVILIARASEWRNYEPVTRGPNGVNLTHFLWDIKDGKTFVLPQSEGYGREESLALADFLKPAVKGAPAAKRRPVGTQEMFIDDLPTGKMQKLPEGAMPEAHRPREDETQEFVTEERPTQEPPAPIDLVRSEAKTDPSQHQAKTDPQQPGFYSQLSPIQRGSKPPTEPGQSG